jgi:hypothetical protein
LPIPLAFDDLDLAALNFHGKTVVGSVHDPWF